MIIRPVLPSDLETICRQRRQMFAESDVPTAILDGMEASFAKWLAPHLADGSYFGFLAEESGLPIAGIGLQIHEWPPHPKHPTTEARGYILNVFVEPSHRGQGLAAKLVQRSEEEFRLRGLTYAVLHASTQGRPVYEKQGWNQTSEMSKQL